MKKIYWVFIVGILLVGTVIAGTLIKRDRTFNISEEAKIGLVDWGITSWDTKDSYSADRTEVRRCIFIYTGHSFCYKLGITGWSEAEIDAELDRWEDNYMDMLGRGRYKAINKKPLVPEREGTTTPKK